MQAVGAAQRRVVTELAQNGQKVPGDLVDG
jgi:hypothetical protein